MSNPEEEPTLPFDQAGVPPHAMKTRGIDSLAEKKTPDHVPAKPPSGLHVRCPHCHNPIELLTDAKLETINCTICGSNFSLTDDEDDATRDARGITQVGHFKLVERLGMGGFGAVWKAHDAELDRTVAVKIPRSGQLDKLHQDLFLREARSAAQLRHPNIVPVYEVGRDGDTLYIVSEFVRGIALSDRLTAGPLSAREAVEICAKVADALHHAHEQGVVHRDLKPANVMLDADGEPHLMDFGLARREANEITMTVEGQVLGTPAYMSPEQAQGEGHTADRRSDVYSLGVMLFQLLTGELPFRGNSRMLIHQMIHDEPPSPRKLNGTIPRDLETITLKCLEKDPNRRFETADELAIEFRRYLAGEPILSRPITRMEQGWRWAKRKPLVAGLTVATTAALVLGIAGVTWQWRKAEFARNAATSMAENERIARELAQQRTLELDQERKHLRDELHLSNLLRADSLFHKGELTQAEELLWHTQLTQPSPKDQRAEWALRRIYLESPRTGVLPVAGQVIALSADGSRLATADNIARVTSIFDRHSGRTLATIPSQHGRISSVSLSAEGSLVAVGYDTGGVIEVWEASINPTLKVTFKSTEKIEVGLGLATAAIMQGSTREEIAKAFTFAAQARIIIHFVDMDTVIASDSIGLYVWDVSGGKVRAFNRYSAEQTPYALYPPRIVSVSPDGDRFLSTHHPDNHVVLSTVKDNVIEEHPLMRTANGESIVTEQTEPELAPLKVRAIGISEDWSLLATQEENETLSTWDFNSRRRTAVKKLPSIPGLHELFVPNNGTFLVGWAGRSIFVWDFPTLSERSRFPGLESWLNDVALSADGVELLIAGGDGVIGTYVPSAPSPTGYIRNGGGAMAIGRQGPALSLGRSGRWLEICEKDQHRKIDLNRTIFGMPMPSNYKSISISPNGKTAALASQGIISSALDIFDLMTLIKTASIPLPGSAIGQSVYSARGDQVAIVTGDGVSVVDLNSQKITATVDSDIYFFGAQVAVSANGQMLAESGSRLPSGTDKVSPSIVQIFNLATQKKIAEVLGESCGSLAFSPSLDSQLLAIADGTSAILYDTKQLQPRAVFTADNNKISSLGFSSNGTLLAIGHQNGTLRIWDVAKRNELVAIAGEDGGINQIVFTEDNSSIRYADNSQYVELHLSQLDKNIDGHRSHYLKREVLQINREQGRALAESFIEQLEDADARVARDALVPPH